LVAIRRRETRQR